MKWFGSTREKKFWLWASLVLIAIYSSIVVALPISEFLRDRELIDAAFGAAFFLVIITVIMLGISTKPRKVEIGVLVGIIAVYTMVFLRMAIPEERTHLIEYGVFAVLIHEALKERNAPTIEILRIGIMAIMITAFFGSIDECIQAFVPQRVFDLRDIGFNALAGVLAVSAKTALTWVRDQKV